MPGGARLAWRTNAWLFVATAVSVFITGFDPPPEPRHLGLLHAAQFTGSLLAILLAHEFGHYIAARVHKVEATLPFFLPMPFIFAVCRPWAAVIRIAVANPDAEGLSWTLAQAGPLAEARSCSPALRVGRRPTRR